MANSEVGIINSSRANENSFPANLRVPGVLVMEDEREAKAVDEQS